MVIIYDYLNDISYHFNRQDIFLPINPSFLKLYKKHIVLEISSLGIFNIQS